MNERAELGIDGNCGFALLGPDLQEGEAEFVEIPAIDTATLPAGRHEAFTQEERLLREHGARLWAAKEAWQRLKTRLNKPNLSYYFGRSHPYGN